MQQNYDDTSDQLAVRKEKRARLLAAGRDPYPPHLEITHTIADVRAK